MMKYKLIVAIFWGLLYAVAVHAQGDRISNNPLNVPLGDPYILFDQSTDTYYLYGTGGTNNGFVAYTSPDLRTWTKQGVVYTATQDKAWGIKDFWAPEVYAYRGKFYLFYSAHWKDNPGNELENYRIGVAVADKPSGPFKDISGMPLFDPGYPIIDANVYFAEDGKLYLYYSRCCYKHPVHSEIATWAKNKGWYNEIEESWVYGVELAADFSGTIGEPTLLLQPPTKMSDQQAEWESRSVTAKEVNRRWTEGSYVFKYGDVYYMMYSANHFAGENYAVGYATASNPLGPFKKSAFNPLLQKNTDKGGIVSGTGHNSVFMGKDGKRWCVYHGRTTRTGDQRLVFMDEMQIGPSGELHIDGPTVRADTR